MCGITREDTQINQRVQAMTSAITYKSYHTKIPTIKDIHTMYIETDVTFFEETKSETVQLK